MLDGNNVSRCPFNRLVDDPETSTCTEFMYRLAAVSAARGQSKDGLTSQFLHHLVISRKVRSHGSIKKVPRQMTLK